VSDAPPERVAKLMAARGLCSRREAERLIDAGCVLVAGVPVAAQGAKAPPDAEIRITEAGRRLLGGRATVLLHKPLGIVSTQPEPGQTAAWQLVRAATRRGTIAPAVEAALLADPQSLAVAGRLDRASRGLLVLTQDGTVARRIIGGQGVEKEYLVRTDAPATDGQLHKLNRPMRLDGQPLCNRCASRASTARRCASCWSRERSTRSGAARAPSGSTSSISSALPSARWPSAICPKAAGGSRRRKRSPSCREMGASGAALGPRDHGTAEQATSKGKSQKARTRNEDGIAMRPSGSIFLPCAF
jgi:23S rRNA pseudouridine2604 synthase